MDDWDAEVDEADAQRGDRAQGTTGRAAGDPEAVAELARRLEAASNPVLVAGPDIDASGAWDAAVALAERQNLPVFAIPATGGGRLGFPEGHPNFRGVLPPAIGPLVRDAGRPRPDPRRRLLGLPLLPEHPRAAAARGRERWSRSPPTPTRRRGRRWATRSSPTSSSRSSACSTRSASPTATRASRCPSRPPARSEDPITGTAAMNALAGVFPDDGIVVLEAPSSTLALRNQLRISRPGSYYFGAGGGLGFGLSAAVGVQLAQPDRPVVCVVGEGSVQYAVTAFWSAVAYDVAGHLPGPAKQRVRDPQVVRGDRGGRGRARARPARARHRRGRRRLRRRRAASVDAADELREALAGGDRRRQPGAGRGRGRRRGCGCSSARRVRRTWRCSSRRSSRSLRADRRRAPMPRPTGSPPGPRSRCAASSSPCSAPIACSARASDLVRYASDASPYRLFPQAVVMARDADDVAKVLAYGRRTAIPVVFRAGGTSLNGQGQTDGILVDVRRHWRGVEVERRRRPGAGQAGDGARPRQPRARPARLQARPRSRPRPTSPASAA